MTIGLHRSHLLDRCVISGSLLASAATLALPRSIPIQAALLGLIGLFSVLAWRHLRPCVSAMRLEPSGEISLCRAANMAFVPAVILPGATVHPWLTVVRFKTDDESGLNLIVTVDSLKASDFRRLRIFLRWRADFSEMSDAA